MEFAYSALEKVIFNEASTAVLPRLLRGLSYQRPFMVASRTLAEKTGDLSVLRQALPVEVVGFNKAIRSHTPREDALELLDQVRESGADVIISVGGGSVIDAGKFVQLAIEQGLKHESEILEYAQQANGSRGPKHGDFRLFSSTDKIRQLAIPTTLSGAEFSNSAGVLNSSSGSKEGYRGPRLCPQVVVYDPELARHTPSWLWLSTAIRSLDHAIEGFCSGQSSAYLDGHFLHAITLFSQSLPAASLSGRSRRDQSESASRLAGLLRTWYCPTRGESRDRLHTWCHVRHSAWLYLMRHVARGARVECYRPRCKEPRYR